MCLLFAFVNPNPKNNEYKLVIVNNRDEFYDRPTEDAHVWNTLPKIVAGKDLMPGREGGTWLCASAEGKIGCLLNLFRPKGEFLTKDAAARGFLALDFLLKDVTGSEYLQNIRDCGVLYNNFNLVLFEPDDTSFNVMYFNNEENDIVTLKKGIHGFGNCVLTRKFKKVLQGEEQFGEIVSQFGSKEHETELINALFDMMKSDVQHYPDDCLRERGKGHPESFYKGLSSIFVKVPPVNYGTRTSTIILVDNGGNMLFQERTMTTPSSSYDEWNQSSYKMSLQRL